MLQLLLPLVHSHVHYSQSDGHATLLQKTNSDPLTNCLHTCLTSFTVH